MEKKYCTWPPLQKQESPFEHLANIAYKFGINLNDQRESVGLPRVHQIENEPKALKCPNCGANISVQDNKCKYCGTTFYWGGNPNRIDYYRWLGDKK